MYHGSIALSWAQSPTGAVLSHISPMAPLEPTEWLTTAPEGRAGHGGPYGKQVFSDGSAARTVRYAAPLTPSSTWAGRRQKGAGQRSLGAGGRPAAFEKSYSNLPSRLRLFGARLPYSYYAAARAPAMRERAAAGNPGPGARELSCGARCTRPGGLAGCGDHTGQQTGGLPQALWPAVGRSRRRVPAGPWL